MNFFSELEHKYFLKFFLKLLKYLFFYNLFNANIYNFAVQYYHFTMFKIHNYYAINQHLRTLFKLDFLCYMRFLKLHLLKIQFLPNLKTPSYFGLLYVKDNL